MPSYRVKKRHSKADVLGLLDPLLERWFSERFSRLTEPQSYAVPLIHEKRNVLVCSPTGSGKTLTAFLAIINELYRKQLSEGLEDRVYCLYISPLKALANDIKRNLTTPLRELEEMAQAMELPLPEIRTAVRSGDTSTSERSKMARKPPHILITTPESISIILSSPKFSTNLEGLEYLIVDEIHELCNNKRGVMLSLSLERLESRTPGFTRIGLSATQAPIEEIAGFLAGYEDNIQRDMGIVEAVERKRLDIGVLCPVEDMTALPFDVVNDRMYDLVGELIKQHTTTLVFTNTRAGTEHVSYRLQERGLDNIAAHHGSLSKETRLDVEDSLKAGELKAVVSSTSLELGIDIGSIDLVCQIGSPKSIAKGLQRIGRAGHSVGAVPTGRFIAFEPDDLVECAVLARHAKEAHIDRVSIPENSLDILAQTIVGMSVEKRWDVEEAFQVIRRAHPYRNLSRSDFTSVIKYLGDRDSDVSFGRIWYDPVEDNFGVKKGSRMIYYLNQGAIPDESNYAVFSSSGRRIGQLSEKFVERLSPGDVFVLGGQSHEYRRSSGMKVFVTEAPGRKPTVPSWTGEMLPRSFDLSMAIGEFRREMMDRVEEEGLDEHLRETYHVDEGSARSIVSYFREQTAFNTKVPNDRNLVLEGYVDMRERHNIIFHACYGRRVNDALSRAYALAISNRHKCSVSVSITDDSFMLTLSKLIPIEDVSGLVTSQNIEVMLRSAVRETGLFRQRFRHCAARSFLILRNYMGREISVGRQQSRSDRLIKALAGEEHPVVVETYNEILNQTMDLSNARGILESVENGDIEVVCLPFSTVPSPFAHGIVLAGISDIILMEDRSALLRELHRQVLEKLMPEEDVNAFEFTAERVKEYFSSKAPNICAGEDIMSALSTIGPLNLTQHKGDNIFAYARELDKVMAEAQTILEFGGVVSLWKKDLYWTLKDEAPYYTKLFMKEVHDKTALAVLEKLKRRPLIIGDIPGDADEVEDALKLLERSNVVCRMKLQKGKYFYMPRPEKDITPEQMDDFIDRCLARTMAVHGPMTREEIAYRVGVEQARVNTRISYMESQGIVSSGRYVVGDDIQYMLSRDLMRLRYGEVYTTEDVKKVLWEKHTTVMERLAEYLTRYGSIARPYDLYPRGNQDTMKEWVKLREKGEIVEGKFEDGRMSYILKKDIPLYVSVFRQRALKPLEKKILSYITSKKGVSMDDLKREFPNEPGLRDAVASLEMNIHLVKAYTGVDGWSKRSIYLPLPKCDSEIPRDAADREMLKRFIARYGPVPPFSLKYSGIPRGRLEAALKGLQKKDEAVRILVASEGGTQEHIMLKEEISLIGQGEPVRGTMVDKVDDKSGRAYIMSLYDPYVQPMWAEVSSLYGEKWIHPCFIDGRMVGAVEKWDMSGCHEIRDILLEDESFLSCIARAIAEEYKHHEAQGVDIVRVKAANSVEVENWPKTHIKVFTDIGFKLVGGVLALGPVASKVFSEKDIMRYVMAKQHLGDYQVSGTMGMVRLHGGARRIEEVNPRAHDPSSLESLLEEGLVVLVKGIPDVLLYATIDQAVMYQNARGKTLSRNMRMVYDMLVEEKEMKREEIIRLSPLSEGPTLEALKKLFHGVYLARNHKNAYVPIPLGKRGIKQKYEKTKARKELVSQLFMQFGIFSASGITGYLRGELRMKEVRDILAELVDERFLAKGFLMEGSDEVYWMLQDDLVSLKKLQARPTVVISPEDRLIYYLSSILMDRFGMSSGYLVIEDGELSGMFRARRSKKGLDILSIAGGESTRRIAEDLSRREEKPGKDKDEEWELIQYVERHVKGRSPREIRKNTKDY